MKKYILVFLLLFLFTNTYSQEYFPLVEENKTWYVISSFFGGNEYTYTFKCEGDTLVDGLNYKSVFRTEEEFPVNWTKKGFIVETDDHKIYYSDFRSNDNTYFKPQLLYDFDAVTGDSLTIFPVEITDSLEIVISTIDSILVDGNYRQLTWFTAEMGEGYWIEGIGSNSGLLEVGFYCVVICPGLDMGCVKKDDVTIYPNGFTGNCYVVGFDEENEERQLCDIFPNPASDYIIISPKSNSNSTLVFEIINAVGMKILQTNLKDNYPTQINISNFERGLYLYNISSENIIVQNGKIVVR